MGVPRAAATEDTTCRPVIAVVQVVGIPVVNAPPGITMTRTFIAWEATNVLAIRVQNHRAKPVTPEDFNQTFNKCTPRIANPARPAHGRWREVQLVTNASLDGVKVGLTTFAGLAWSASIKIKKYILPVKIARWVKQHTMSRTMAPGNSL